MEDKKMPFAVFVLKYIENMVKDYKEGGQDEFEVLYDVMKSCRPCPLRDKCSHSCGVCRDNMMKYVERAE